MWRLPLSFVLLDGRWRALDVANGLVFRNALGERMTTEELASDPQTAARAAGGRLYRGQPYQA